MSGQPSVLQVVILRDGLLVGTEVVIPGSFTIGSDPSSDLVLDDPSVSPRHALLYFQNGRAAIQDVGSPRGVYVNGHRVSACEIRSSDEVMCGPFVLKTRVLSQRPQEVRPPPPPEVAALLANAAAPVPAPLPYSPPPPVAQRALGSAQALAATVPGRSTPPPSRSPLAQEPVRTSPTRPSHSELPLAAVSPPPPPPVPTVQPVARAQSAPGTQVFGHGASAEPAADATPRVPAARVPTPSATMPSVRRRHTPPAGAEARGPQLADLLMEDLSLPPLSVPGAPAPDLALLDTPQVDTPAEQADASGRPTHAPRVASGKGPSQLYLELYWGAVRREARAFAPAKKPVLGAADELAPMPLWGFQLPEESFSLAESVNGTWRLRVPPNTQLEKSGPDGRFAPLPRGALETDGARRFLTLREGSAVRLTQGDMSLVAYPAPRPSRVFVSPLHDLPWVALGCLGAFSALFLAFLALQPEPRETADFAPRNIAPVALRLITPEPKKKEEAQKKLAALQEKAPKPTKAADRPVARKVDKTPPRKAQAQAQAPASRTLKALEKLSAAGPANGALMAAMDKLGSGPGSKNVKSSNYKLSGLIGKAPIANAGLGGFGLGGGGKGGGATLGAELLRGKGGGGIGAMGAGGVGKGKVGGTVTRATARSISAQGSIDRDAVARVVNSHLQQVHSCYERALLREPGLAGKVVLEWTIATNGRVASARTKSSTLRNQSVEACILASLKSWTFPPAKGGSVIITYPFLFNSVGY